MVGEDVKKQIVLLCASRKTRSAEFTRDRPVDWSPTSVVCPDSQQPFTEDGAWEFIADLVKGGCEIEIILLDKPPGKKGYVIKCADGLGRRIYIKLQIGSGIIFGRSFHVSKKD